MTETEIDKKKPGPKPKAAMSKLLETVKTLSPEERKTLESLGFVMPLDVEPDALDKRPKYGYYCQQCGDMALFFVGTQFTQNDGSVGAHPNLAQPIQNLPFIQPHLPREKVNRHKPICQMCYVPIHHNSGRLDPRRVVDIQEWNKGRDEAFEKMRKPVKLEGTSIPWKAGTADRPVNPRSFSKEYLSADERGAIDDAAQSLDLNKLGRR